MGGGWDWVCDWLPICGSGRESGFLTLGCRDLPAKPSGTPDLLARYCGTVRPGLQGKKKGESSVWSLAAQQVLQHGEQFEFVPDQGTCRKGGRHQSPHAGTSSTVVKKGHSRF